MGLQRNLRTIWQYIVGITLLLHSMPGDAGTHYRQIISGNIIDTSYVNDMVQGSGKLATVARKPEARFSSIQSDGSFEINVRVGRFRRSGITITGDDNLIEKIQVRVADGVLKIQTPDNFSFSTEQPIRVDISTQQLKALGLGGSTKSTVLGLNTKAFDLNASGSAEVALRGFAGRFNLQADGSSIIHAADFAAPRLNVRAEGSSQLDLHSGSAEVTAEGSSQITIRRSQPFMLGIRRALGAGFGAFAALSRVLASQLTGVRVDASGSSAVTVHRPIILKGSCSGSSCVRYSGKPAELVMKKDSISASISTFAEPRLPPNHHRTVR